ncbi:VUT family protein [Mycobacterium sp. SA01]|uniref:VUT family protein n=1 Tax=Mycobacterium sp. SA01 TaxID=3238820 RepID=UPI00351B9ADA
MIHRRIGSAGAFGLIAISAPLTAAFATPALAVASVLTFLVAETADLAVYQRLKHRHAVAVLGSNLVSSAVDSIMFLAIAFGVAHAAAGSLGLTIGKVEASVLTFASILALARIAHATPTRRALASLRVSKRPRPA